MKIVFHVDQAAAIRGGHNDHGQREREIDVAALSQEDRDLLASVIDYEGKATRVPNGSGQVVSVTADAPTAAGLMAGVRRAVAEAARLAAGRRAKEDEELALTEAEDAAALAEKRLRKSACGFYDQWEPDHGRGWRLLNYAKGREAELATRNSPAWSAWLEEIAARNAAEKAAYDARAAEKRAADERAAAEKKAREEAGRAVLRAWAKEHGGDLARLRLEEGYDCWLTAARDDYAESVFAAVAAGLEPAEEPDGTDGRPEVEERKCPAAAEIKALRAVRTACEGHPAAAELVYVRYDRADDADESEVPAKQYRAELEITVTCPDGHEEQRYYLIPE